MFENLEIGGSLDENQFDEWLIDGRESKIRYSYLVVIWDEMEKYFRPVYLVDRGDLEKYIDDPSKVGNVFIAAYDLYSESKIM